MSGTAAESNALLDEQPLRYVYPGVARPRRHGNASCCQCVLFTLFFLLSLILSIILIVIGWNFTVSYKIECVNFQSAASKTGFCEIHWPFSMSSLILCATVLVVSCMMTIITYVSWDNTATLAAIERTIGNRPLAVLPTTTSKIPPVRESELQIPKYFYLDQEQNARAPIAASAPPAYYGTLQQGGCLN